MMATSNVTAPQNVDQAMARQRLSLKIRKLDKLETTANRTDGSG